MFPLPDSSGLEESFLLFALFILKERVSNKLKNQFSEIVSCDWIFYEIITGYSQGLHPPAHINEQQFSFRFHIP
jgi:hypothetical protein